MKTFLKIFVVFLRLKKEEFLAHDWELEKEIFMIFSGVFVGLCLYLLICFGLSKIIPVLLVEDICVIGILGGFATFLSVISVIPFKRFICDNWKKATEEVMSKSIK